MVLAIADDHTRTDGRDGAGFEPEASPPDLPDAGSRTSRMSSRGSIHGRTRRPRLSGWRSIRTERRSASNPGRVGSTCWSWIGRTVGSFRRRSLCRRHHQESDQAEDDRGRRPLLRRGPFACSMVREPAPIDPPPPMGRGAGQHQRRLRIGPPVPDFLGHTLQPTVTEILEVDPRSGTRSLRTEETTISPGPPTAPTLAPVWTATPPTFPPKAPLPHV